jgi:hypothetical protein
VTTRDERAARGLLPPAGDWCGCCGRPCGRDELWCADCSRHVANVGQPHERTWFATHGGEDCPFTQEPRRAGILGGIEYFRVPGRPDLEAQCARCGSSVEWNPCGSGCDDGWVESDDWQDFDDEDSDQPCGDCGGRGGSWHCLSTPEWCEAHPLPGREQIPSTALRSEVWNL